MADTVTLPYDINNGDALDADKVMADLEAITTEYNSEIAAKAGSIVSTTETQTLTNKTLTSPVLNGTLTGTGYDAIIAAIAAKKITHGFTWYLDGTSIVADEVGAKYLVPANMTVTKIVHKTVSGTATIRVQADTTTVDDSISVTSTAAAESTITSASLTANQVLTLDITAVSSCVGLTVTVWCEE